MTDSFLSQFQLATFFLPLLGLTALSGILISVMLWRRVLLEQEKRAHTSDILLKRSRELEATKTNVEHERDQLTAILSSMGEGLLVVGKDHKTILMNQAANILLRTAAKETGWDANEIFQLYRDKSPKSETDKLFDEVIKEADIVNIGLSDSFTCKIREGMTFPITFIMAPLLRHGKVIGAIVVFRDATKEKAVDRAKTEFVSLASHQLRTPLTAIRLFVEMLSTGEVGELSEKQKDYIDNVDRSTKRMIALVNELLNVSRLETGRLRVDPVEVQLEEAIAVILQEIRFLAHAKSCNIEFEKPEKRLPKIPIDVGLLGQVLGNLISNAIKYSAKESCTVHIKLELKTDSKLSRQERSVKYVQISVQDNGIGIPREVQSRIFERFFRSDNAMKADPEGSGLGLYVAKIIMVTAGGKVWFESKEGKGTTFYVTIPIKGMKKREGERGIAK